MKFAFMMTRLCDETFEGGIWVKDWFTVEKIR